MGCDTSEARKHRMKYSEPLTKSAPKEAASSQAPSTQALASGAMGIGDADAPPMDGMTLVDDDRRSGATAAEYGQQVDPRKPSPFSGNNELTELLDTASDELSMCLRYHQGLFPERTINRAIFLGGEARQMWLCRHIVQAMRVPSQLGDPLARMTREPGIQTPGVNLDRPQPGWAVACGLCTAPTDL
jgi:hypothetical protein